MSKVQIFRLGRSDVGLLRKKSAFAAGQLPFESRDFVINVPETDGCARACNFTINVKFAAKTDVNHLRQFLNGGRSYDIPQETIQAFDVVLREIASKGREIRGDKDRLRWTALANHVFRHGPLGNDMAARAFYSNGKVSDFVMVFLNKKVSSRLLHEDLKPVLFTNL